MGGNPSGRGQTLLLAEWLRDQVAACTSPDSTGTDMPVCRESKQTRANAAVDGQPYRAPDGSDTAEAGNAPADELSVSHGSTTARSAAAAATAASPPCDQNGQEQYKAKHAAMVQEPVLASPASPSPCSPRGKAGYMQSKRVPVLPSSACEQTLASWQGLLPQESDSLGLRFWAEDIIRNRPDQGKRVLGLLGVGLGLLVHQVAMHCFERGALMAAVWNVHTALMDAEVQSLEAHIQVTRMQSPFRERSSSIATLLDWQCCVPILA